MKIIRPLTSQSAARLLVALALFAGGCITPLDNAPSPSPASTTAGTDSIAVYFTDPGRQDASRYRGGPDEALAAAIDGARVSVDVAVLQLNLWSIRDAMLDAHRRGVAVRLVTDSDYLDEDEVQEMKDAGVPVLGDRREGLMHDKFVVIDRMEVWTGSMNYTTSDGYRNNNNLVRIRSPRLAEDYTVEFEEMFVDDLFGPNARADTPYPQVSLDGTSLEVYFSPDDGAAAHLVEKIAEAHTSIQFMAYSFTSDDLAGAILERARAGVAVAGVMDAGQVASNEGGEFERFRSAGLQVRQDGNPNNMHHKVIIIDGETVITGSYNFSRNAERVNDENALIIHSPQVAAQYQAEFERLFAQAQKP